MSQLPNTKPQTNEASRNGTAKPRPTGGVYTPRVDLVETEDALILFADLPGVKQEDVSLTCKGDQLFLSATCPRRHEGKTPLYAEYGVGNFSRSFRITELVETGGIEASLKDGVLIVRLPKAEAVRPRRIAVTSA